MLRLAPAGVSAHPLSGGGVLLGSTQELEPYPARVGCWLDRFRKEAPDRVFLAQRSPEGDWRRVTYAEVSEAVERIAQALLDRGLAEERPLAILSDNGIDNALLQLGAMEVGIPVVPISPSYSLLSKDFLRLRHILRLTRPGLVYAESGRRFERAMGAVDEGAWEWVVSSEPPERLAVSSFSDLLARPGASTEAYRKKRERVGPDTVAKILFTSGSTGAPRGVINTHRMLCSNQQAIRQLWAFLTEKPPVLVDWLPWHHTFGGNHNLNLVLANGGTLYVDEGKPLPGLIEKTVANLREISPTLYFNVPRGFDMLLPFLEREHELSGCFFRNLDGIFYAGAALPQSLWDRLERVALETLGRRITMLSAWGSTETAPMATQVHFPIERAANIGLPAPGTEIKLAPSGTKHELRVRGPNVTPGYYADSELTRRRFDEEGFFRSGDAGRLADPEDPSRGLVFDGRIAEDFKLMSGSWVHVGPLRLAAIAAASPLIQDAVIAGEGREEIGLLIFPSPEGCRRWCSGALPETPLSELICRPEVRKAVQAGLARRNTTNPSTSTRIARVLLMVEPPSIDANEITDKGYINQRAVLERRRDLVEKLYSDDPDVLTIS